MALPLRSKDPAWLSADMKYDKEKQALAHGEYSQIYKANETGSNKILAVKVYDDLVTRKQDSQRRKLIEHEAAMLAAVRNGPHIIFAGPARYLDVSNRSVEIPMDFYEHDLAFLLKQTKGERGIRGTSVLVPLFYHTVLSQMLEALEFLHTEANIVHRQVKPTNILYNNVHHFVLADFGIAGKLDAAPPLDESTLFHGYMPPEKYEAMQYATAVDIWGLGIICGITLFARGETSLTKSDQEFDQEEWSNFWPKMCAMAHLSKKPELLMMLDKDPSKRSTAKDLAAFVKNNIDPNQKDFRVSEDPGSTSLRSETERHRGVRDPVPLAATSAQQRVAASASLAAETEVVQKEKDADLLQSSRNTRRRLPRSSSLPRSKDLQRSAAPAISFAVPTLTRFNETAGPSSSAAQSVLKESEATASPAHSVTTSKEKKPEERTRKLGPVTEPTIRTAKSEKLSSVIEPTPEQLGETAQKSSLFTEPSPQQAEAPPLSKYQKQKAKKQRRNQRKSITTTAPLPLVPQKAAEPPPEAEADALQITRTPQPAGVSDAANREQGASLPKAPALKPGQGGPPSKTPVAKTRQGGPTPKGPVANVEQKGPPPKASVARAEKEEPPPEAPVVRAEQVRSPPKALDVRTGQRGSPPKASDVRTGLRGSPPKALDARTGQRDSPAEAEVSISRSSTEAPRGLPPRTGVGSSPARVGARVSPQRVGDTAPQATKSPQATTARQGTRLPQSTWSSQSVGPQRDPRVPQNVRPSQVHAAPQAAGFPHPGGFTPSMGHAPPVGVGHLQWTQYPPSVHHPPPIGYTPPFVYGQPIAYPGAMGFPSTGSFAQSVGYPQSVGLPNAAASSQATTFPRTTGTRRAPGEEQRGRPQTGEDRVGLSIRAAQSATSAQRQSGTANRAPNTTDHGASTDSPPRLSSPWAQSSGAITVQSRLRSASPAQ